VKRALIDAGPVIALFDQSDQYHRIVYHFMEKYEGRLITTWPVMTEVSYMLDFNSRVRLDFLSWVYEGGIELHNTEQWELARINAIIKKYEDLPADLADASLLQAAETLRLKYIISLDRDFGVYRLDRNRKLINLLDPVN